MNRDQKLDAIIDFAYRFAPHDGDFAFAMWSFLAGIGIGLLIIAGVYIFG